MVASHSDYTKTTTLYTLKWWFLGYMNYMVSLKPSKKTRSFRLLWRVSIRKGAREGRKNSMATRPAMAMGRSRCSYLQWADWGGGRGDGRLLGVGLRMPPWVEMPPSSQMRKAGVQEAAGSHHIVLRF